MGKYLPGYSYDQSGGPASLMAQAAPRAKLREFKMAPWWRNSLPWGNGHTVDTDPTRKGWRLRQAGRDPDVVLVGRANVEGCFSVRPLEDGGLDVAIYLDTPQYVVRTWKEGCYCDASYHEIASVDGWGLECIRLLEAKQAAIAAIDLFAEQF